MATPNAGIPYVPENTLDPAAGLNLSLNVIDALLQTAAIDMNRTSPPSSPADGDLHIIATGATGAWAGHDGALARYVAVGAQWQFYPAGTNVFLVLNKADGALYAWNGSAWVAPLAAGAVAAASVSYNPSTSGLTATNVQAALDEIAAAAGVPDGDKGDVVVTGGGVAWALDFSASTFDDDATLAANSAARLATQRAVKAYVDSLVLGLSWKRAVRAATTTNGALASAYQNGSSIDGVTLATGDRILIKDQTASSENGIYIVQTSGAPTRAADADAGSELVNATVYVSEGASQADTQWTCSANAPITLGSTSLPFVQLTAGGGAGGALGQSINSPALPIAASLATYYLGDGTDAALSSLASVALNRLYYVPFTVPNAVSITALGVNVISASASQKARVGIYSNVQTSGRNRPNALLASTGDISIGTTGIQSGAAAITLVPGTVYWLGIAQTANPGTFLGCPTPRFQMGRLAPSNHNPINYLYEVLSGGWTTLPATAAATLTAGNGAFPVAAATF